MPANQFSNYPSGFASGLVVRGLPIMQAQPGRALWLYNGTALEPGEVGGADGNRGTYERPFATLNYALTKCTAGRGDTIFIKPGHAETISSATALALSTAGVAIVGLGSGSSRPKFTLDTANTSTITVSADNISIQNCQFFANFLSIAACFTLTTAKEFYISNCYFRDTSSILNFLNIIKSTGAANTVDGLSLLDSTVVNLGVTSNNTTVLSANDIDRLQIVRNYMKWAVQNDTAIAVIITAGVLTNALVTDNYGYRPNTTTAGGSLIKVGGTTSTGIVANNKVQTLTTTSDLLFTTTVGLAAFNNMVTGVVGASGFLIPAADS